MNMYMISSLFLNILKPFPLTEIIFNKYNFSSLLVIEGVVCYSIHFLSKMPHMSNPLPMHQILLASFSLAVE